MFTWTYVILGYMRDGKVWNGYQLWATFEKEARTKANRATFYVKLAELRKAGLVAEVKGVVPDNGVPAESGMKLEKPGQITDAGRREFDTWLFSNIALKEDFTTWLLFLASVPPDTLDAMLHRKRNQAWLISKSLANQIEFDVADASLDGAGYRAGAMLAKREWQYACAELEFIEEVQREVARLRATGQLPIST